MDVLRGSRAFILIDDGAQQILDVLPRAGGFGSPALLASAKAAQAEDLICKENDVGDSCSSLRFFFFPVQGRIALFVVQLLD